MKIVRSHKIRLDPTKEQAQHFHRACGCARQAYNWAVARTKEMLDAGEKPTDKILKTEFNAIKRSQFPWQREVRRTESSKEVATEVAEVEQVGKQEEEGQFQQAESRSEVVEAALPDSMCTQ